MTNIQTNTFIGSLLLATLIGLGLPVSAQDRDRGYRERDERVRFTRILPGKMVVVRTNETIDVERRDYRVYAGIIDQDIRGDNGILAIPRGSTVELMVRVTPENDLIIDLESVVADGERYAIRTTQKRIESLPTDDSLVGSIIGAINGVETRGRTVRIPRDTVLTFRVVRPLDMGVPDRGTMRDGHHYHDYYVDR